MGCGFLCLYVVSSNVAGWEIPALYVYNWENHLYRNGWFSIAIFDSGKVYLNVCIYIYMCIYIYYDTHISMKQLHTS